METAIELIELLTHGDVTASEIVATCTHRIAETDDAPVEGVRFGHGSGE